MVSAGEGCEPSTGVPQLYRTGGAGKRTAAGAAAAVGFRGGPSEAGQSEHAGRPEQLLQYAGGSDFGGLRGAGQMDGAGGAGIYGLRGHSQLCPALL